MSDADQAEKRMKTMEFKASAAMHDRILRDVLKAHDKSKNIKSAVMQPNVWRIIMKTRVAKLAAAAAIIIAVGLTLTVFDKSLSSAYAIEQTIEAMRSIHSIHAYCTDWDDSKGEAWVQTDPETGQEEYYHADQGNLLIVGTPEATYYYYKDKNLVRIRDEYVPASEVRISRFFEDMVKWIQQYHGQLGFYFQFDEDLQQEVIMVHGSIPTQGDIEEKEFIFRVDPETKLPIDMEALKCGPGQGVKSVDRIEYNVTIPEGIFEFKIPAGAKVVYEKKDGKGG
ncbi:MAG: hypothetical protein ACYS4W_03040 [Planctomycetota bacterium]|jgi:hypothetical protein